MRWPLRHIVDIRRRTGRTASTQALMMFRSLLSLPVRPDLFLRVKPHFVSTQDGQDVPRQLLRLLILVGPPGRFISLSRSSRQLYLRPGGQRLARAPHLYIFLVEVTSSRESSCPVSLSLSRTLPDLLQLLQQLRHARRVQIKAAKHVRDWIMLLKVQISSLKPRLPRRNQIPRMCRNKPPPPITPLP